MRLHIFSLRNRPYLRWGRGKVILLFALLGALGILLFVQQKEANFFFGNRGKLILQELYLLSQGEHKSELEPFYADKLKRILQAGLPFFSGQNNQALTGEEASYCELWGKCMYISRDPRAIVGLEMGWLSALEKAGWGLLMPVNTRLFAAPAEVIEPYVKDMPWEADLSPSPESASESAAKITEDKILPALDKPAPLIGIYCTHNAETYLPTAGKSRVEGEKGGVDQVAQVLKKTLEEDYGVPTVYVDTIHDYPDWSKAYANSGRTIQNLLHEHENLRILVDVHRDSLPTPAAMCIKIKEEKIARLLFVVGSDKRRVHPHWQKNLALAQQIAHSLDAQYPGLCRGVRVQEGAYNQHLHPGAILVEVGNDNNTLEEAERAAIILAGALKEVLGSISF